MTTPPAKAFPIPLPSGQMHGIQTPHGGGLHGCLIATPSCACLVNALGPSAPPTLRVGPFVRLVAGLSALLGASRSRDTYLELEGLAVGIASGPSAFAAVLAPPGTDPNGVTLRAREVAHWFELLCGADLAGLDSELGAIKSDPTESNATKEDVDEGRDGGKGEGRRGRGEETWPRFAPFAEGPLRRIMEGEGYAVSWLGPLVQVPGVAAACLFDLCLTSEPALWAVSPCTDPSGQGRGKDSERDSGRGKNSGRDLGLDDVVGRDVIEAIAWRCESLSRCRRERRAARRAAREGGEASPSRGEKVRYLGARFLDGERTVDVYVKVVRLPEDDPCVVAICPGGPGEGGDEAGWEAEVADSRIPGPIRAALAEASGAIKRHFPNPKTTDVGELRRALIGSEGCGSDSEIPVRTSGGAGAWVGEGSGAGGLPLPPEQPRPVQMPPSVARQLVASHSVATPVGGGKAMEEAASGSKGASRVNGLDGKRKVGLGTLGLPGGEGRECCESTDVLREAERLIFLDGGLEEGTEGKEAEIGGTPSRAAGALGAASDNLLLDLDDVQVTST